MSKYILDASAILALLDNEPGANHVLAIITDSVIGTLNLGEAYSKLAERGRDGQQALAEIVSACAGLHSFSQAQAAITGELRPITSHAGLSFGDRACLALAIDLGAEAYTAERNWRRVPVPCPLHFIR